MLEIKITARDRDGREAMAIFKFFVGAGPQDGKTSQGRTGLTEQIRLATSPRGAWQERALPANATATETPGFTAGDWTTAPIEAGAGPDLLTWLKLQRDGEAPAQDLPAAQAGVAANAALVASDRTAGHASTKAAAPITPGA